MKEVAHRDTHCMILFISNSRIEKFIMTESRASVGWSCGLGTRINERTFWVNGNALYVD